MLSPHFVWFGAGARPCSNFLCSTDSTVTYNESAIDLQVFGFTARFVACFAVRIPQSREAVAASDMLWESAC